MRIFLLKDIEKVGLAGEMVKVADGFASNFLIPRKLGVKVTTANEPEFKKRLKTIQNRKEVIATETSMLAEKIRSLKLILKRKLHDDGKLYGSINASEIVDLLAAESIKIAKNQVIFDKSVKEKGVYPVTIKLSSRLQPKLILKVIAE